MLSVLISFYQSHPAHDLIDDARVQIDAPNWAETAHDAAKRDRALIALAHERCPRGYTVDEVDAYDETTRAITAYVYED